MKKVVLILATFFTLSSQAAMITSRTSLDAIYDYPTSRIVEMSERNPFSKKVRLERRTSPTTSLEDIFLVPGPNRTRVLIRR